MPHLRPRLPNQSGGHRKNCRGDCRFARGAGRARIRARRCGAWQGGRTEFFGTAGLSVSSARTSLAPEFDQLIEDRGAFAVNAWADSDAGPRHVSPDTLCSADALALANSVFSGAV